MYVSQGKSLINGQKDEDNCDAEGQQGRRVAFSFPFQLAVSASYSSCFALGLDMSLFSLILSRQDLPWPGL